MVLESSEMTLLEDALIAFHVLCDLLEYIFKKLTHKIYNFRDQNYIKSDIKIYLRHQQHNFNCLHFLESFEEKKAD